MKETKLLFRDDAFASEILNILKSQHVLFGYVRGRPATVSYEDIYYDSEDSRFSAGTEVLRKRTVQGKSPVFQYKRQSRNTGNDLHFERVQWKTGDSPPAEAPDPTALKECLTINVERVELPLHRGRDSDRLVVHLDTITTSAGAGAQAVVSYEIELKADGSSCGVDVLSEHLQETFGMIPVRKSKFKRACSTKRAGARSGAVPVILDCDPGVDDALAIRLALASPELDVIGVTTVGGNVDILRTTENALSVGAWAASLGGKAAPPVYAGCQPEGDMPDASHVHGPTGCGAFSWPSHGAVEPQTAVEFIRQTVESCPGQVTIVAVGPLTNLARLIAMYPYAALGIGRIVAMGGAFFTTGNRSASSEFNIHRDAAAARRVLEFSRGRIPLTFVGLDVTHRVRLLRSDLDRLGARHPLRRLTRQYMDFYRDNEGLDGCYLHDPLAVACVVDPSLFESESYHVEIETSGEFTRGETILDFRPTRLYRDQAKEVTEVVIKVDSVGAEDMIKRRVLGS